MSRVTALITLLLLASASGIAGASEATVKAALQKKYPQVPVDTVTRTPLTGIYEVYSNGQLIYTDEKVDYLFINGSMVDVARKVNLTEERMNRLTAIKFDQLPLNLAFKKVKGKGERKLAIFSDPDCPFCKRIEGELTKVDNVTIYTFLFPIAGLHPEATERAKRIWCSADKVKAWDDLMQRGVMPVAAPTCENPVDRLVEFGNRNRINGTPTMFFADGMRVAGAIPAEQIEQRLAAAQGK